MIEGEKINKAIAKQIDTLASSFERTKLFKECGKNWDRFYKRNGVRFFKVFITWYNFHFNLYDCVK